MIIHRHYQNQSQSRNHSFQIFVFVGRKRVLWLLFFFGQEHQQVLVGDHPLEHRRHLQALVGDHQLGQHRGNQQALEEDLEQHQGIQQALVEDQLVLVELEQAQI